MDLDRDLGPFDPRLRRLRAARARPEARFLHRRAIDDLIDRLTLVKHELRDTFVLGADSDLVGSLREQGLSVAEGEAGDLIERPARYDLIASVGRLDTINDLPGALVLVRRALRPEGLFLPPSPAPAACRRCAGPCARARGGWARGCPSNPPADRRPRGGRPAAPRRLRHAVVDRDVVEVRYASLPDLVADLRAMGATNQLAGQTAPPFGPAGFAAAVADFAAQAGADGKTAERFEIVHLSGWATPPG